MAKSLKPLLEIVQTVSVVSLVAAMLLQCAP